MRLRKYQIEIMLKGTAVKECPKCREKIFLIVPRDTFADQANNFQGHKTEIDCPKCGKKIRVYHKRIY